MLFRSKARTDPEPLPGEAAGLAGRPEALNLLTIYAALADQTVDQVLAEHAGQGFGAFKPKLGELLVEVLAPITTRFTQLLDDRAALGQVLADGAARARALAAPTLEQAYGALGMVR